MDKADLFREAIKTFVRVREILPMLPVALRQRRRKLLGTGL